MAIISLLRIGRWLKCIKSATISRAERNAVSPEVIGAAITPMIARMPPTAPNHERDTALRSARLIVADFMHLSQRPIRNRLMIAIPLLLCVFGMVFVDFNVVWRYFAWTNQTLAVFTLWAGTVFLYKNSRAINKYPYAYLISLIPALFMTMVSVSYIFIAPEGFHFAKIGLSWVAYLVAGVTTVALLGGFAYWKKSQE